MTNPWPYAALDNYIHFRLRAGWASHAPTGLDPISPMSMTGLPAGVRAHALAGRPKTGSGPVDACCSEMPPKKTGKRFCTQIIKKLTKD